LQRFDTAIIGGGIVGMATAMALVKDGSSSVVVLEAEDRLAAHQSGHNSGVIHAGLYYGPGSLKTRLCVEGREALYRFCAQHGIVHERCGKVVVATDHAEMQRLDALEQRGIANGLQDLRRLDADGLREYEPHVMGVGGLHVPDTGVVDFGAVTQAMAAVVRHAGGVVKRSHRVLAIRRDPDAIVPALQLWGQFDDDLAEALTTIAARIESTYRTPFDRFEQYTVYGDAEMWVERLGGFIEAGVRHFNFVFAGGDRLSQLARISAEVIPRLQARVEG